VEKSLVNKAAIAFSDIIKKWDNETKQEYTKQLILNLREVSTPLALKFDIEQGRLPDHQNVGKDFQGLYWVSSDKSIDKPALNPSANIK